jgi:ubiquinone/menaquinone biosynthesis C-methylase UbiE
MNARFDARKFNHDDSFRQIGFRAALVCFELSQNGTIVGGYPSNNSFLGYSIDDVAGRNIAELFPVNEEMAIRGLVDAASPISAAVELATILRKSGEPLVVSVACVRRGTGPASDVLLVVAQGYQMSVESLGGEFASADRIKQYYATQNYKFSEHFHFGLFNDSDEPFALAADRLLVEFLAETGPREGQTILDIGCGLGAAAFRLLREYGVHRVEGITISEVQLELCQRIAKESGVDPGKASFILMDANEMTLEDGQYDVVIAVESLFHMNRDKVIRSVFQVLKSGGTFAFCDPYPVNGGIVHSKVGSHTLVDVTQSIRLLRKHGFVGIRVLDWTDRVMPSYRRLFGRIARVAKRALDGGLSRDATFDMAERVFGERLSPDVCAEIEGEILAQMRGVSKVNTTVGYCYYSATKPRKANAS